MIHEKIFLINGRDDITLTTYVLDDSPEMLKGKKRPAVLVCPGGAYVNCSDREAEPIALRFNAMGYHAFVLRYSVYTENKRTAASFDGKELAPKKWTTHPEPMRDIARAMLEIRRHADDWLVDMDSIALCGFSAGAHNCAMYSVYWDKPVMSEPFGVHNSLLRPAAAILCYPALDQLMQKELCKSKWASVKGLYDMFFLAFTGTSDPDEKTLAEISPNLHVTPNTPPMFIWATAGDNLVPVQHSTIMATALAEKGIPFELHVFEEGDHGLALSDKSTATVPAQIDTNAANWMPLCEKWLEKRLKLNI